MSMTDEAREIEYRRRTREQVWEKEGEEFAETFSRFVNSSLSEPREAAIKKMLRDHRTLQQGMMRFFMQFVAAMAKSEYDARNVASVDLAQEIMLLDEGPLPRI